jgi:ATP-binding cassette subfamily C protein
MIQGLPDGYNTQVGDGAQTLSGGQRQRIGLARALYGKPALIVLDEPNASLDIDGENALLAALQQLKQEHCTIILITHKTSVLSVVDKVMVLSAGRIQALGSRDEILSKLLGPPRISPVQAPAPVVAAAR